MTQFAPEGYRINSYENKIALENQDSLIQAKYSKKILEAKAILCDNKHNLIIDLGFINGIIPRDETAIGIYEGSTKDIAIISRVNKPVCFIITGFEENNNKITRAILSRRKAQEFCFENKISKLCPGDIIDAMVTHLENFGAFVDIGCGIVSFLPIDTISVSRINHPRERFKTGMKIKVIVKSISENRINLTHKELLGTWEENANNFNIGETVPGIVRSIENYGIFVELTPNLAGLAEPKEGIIEGQQISVYIKNIIPDKMKIKLVIIEAFETKNKIQEPKYFINKSHIEKFIYSPPTCKRIIETDFTKNLVHI
ncbi:MAG: 30S ribosomal protein S1 [Clostridia bacterium]|nr:30S ribosomal protein S1 [Clostridia bacterium]